MENDLTRRLNDVISKTGIGMEPSTTNLILYGPVNRDLITSDNLEILKENEKLIINNYNNHILPKIHSIVHKIIGKTSSFPETKGELSYAFRECTPEERRKKLRDSYKEQFKIDAITSEHLFSDEKISNRGKKEVVYYFTKNSEHIFSIRKKKKKSISKKLKVGFSKMSNVERKDFLYSVVNIAEDNHLLERYNHYSGEYSKENLDMFLADLLGFEMVDMNYERAERKIRKWGEVIKKRGGNHRAFKFHSFSAVEKRSNDRSNRREDERPGGIHLVLYDKLLKYPIEVKYLSIKDKFADLFGEWAHHRYELHGKKANSSTGK